MKVLVTFHSKTGNTEKLAQAIHHAVANTAEKDLLPIADVAGAGHYDLVFVGFPVISHSVPLVTTLSAAEATIGAIDALRKKEFRVKSLQEYHKDLR